MSQSFSPLLYHFHTTCILNCLPKYRPLQDVQKINLRFIHTLLSTCSSKCHLDLQLTTCTKTGAQMKMAPYTHPLPAVQG